MDVFDLGKHAVFIWASYGAVALVLGGVAGWLLVNGARLKRAQQDLENQGVRRRSDEVR